MNTKDLTLTLAVATAAAITPVSLGAGEPFLSPRASENQIQTVRGTSETSEEWVRHGFLSGSPRGREQMIRVVPSQRGEPNLAVRNWDGAVSPRALEQFPWLARRSETRTEAPSLVHKRNH